MNHKNCYLADAEAQYKRGLITTDELATAKPVIVHRGCETVRKLITGCEGSRCASWTCSQTHITESELRLLDGNR